jgi:hypothetical protein
MSALQLLDASHNPQLCGSLPSSWARMAFLRTLQLRHTGMVGSLPHEWSALQRLLRL